MRGSTEHDFGELQALWQSMMSQSFSPRDWFTDRDWRDDDSPSRKEKIMWVYKQLDYEQWAVGYWSPEKEWFQDAIYSTKEEAAERVHWLNGGGI